MRPLISPQLLRHGVGTEYINVNHCIRIWGGAVGQVEIEIFMGKEGVIRLFFLAPSPLFLYVL